MAIYNNSGNNGKNYIVVPNLPIIGEEDKVYLIPNPSGSEDNQYIEYGFVNGKWEIIGYSDITNNINIDMSGYLTVKQAEKDYQPKGNYLTDEDNKNLVSKQLLKTELARKQNKGETVTLTASEKLIGEDKDGNPHLIASVNKQGNILIGDSKSHLNLTSLDKITINNEDIIATENFVDRKVKSINIPTEEDFATKTEYRKIVKIINEIDSKLPTKVSDLKNDAGYITSEDIPEGYDDRELKKSIKELNKKIEELEKQGGYDDSEIVKHIKNLKSSINNILDRLELLENKEDNVYDDSEIRQLIRDLKNEIEYKQDKGNYATVDFVNRKIEGFATKKEIETILDSKADKSLLDVVVGSLYEEGEFVKTEELNAKLSQLDFVTNKQLISELSKKGDKDLLDTVIHTLFEEDYFVKSDYFKEELSKLNLLDTENLVTKEELKDVENKIPTKLSAFENDTNFITEEYDDSEIKNRIDELEKIDHDVFATKIWVEDKNYLTKHQDISNLAKKSEIPTKTSELVNDSGFLTEHQSLANYAKTADVNTLLDEKSDISFVNEKIDEINSALENKANKSDLDDVVKYEKFVYTNSENETSERKTIQLDNYDSISGVTTDGKGCNLVMLSKWNVADFGSGNVHLNLNTVDNVTINDTEVIVTENDIKDFISKDIADEKYQPKGDYLTEHQDVSMFATKDEVEISENEIKEDINSIKDNFVNYTTKSELNNLKDFIKAVLDKNIDVVTTQDNKTKTEGNLIVTGEYVGNKERTTYTVNNGNLNCYDLNITDSSLALIAPNGDVSVTELKTEGNCFTPNKLRCLSIDGGKEILIKDCNLNEVCYNGIQINMDKALSNNITIDNINMDGVQNNGIIVFGTKDDAIINIKNVNIVSAKNAFRFSNRSNAKNIVVNIENVTIGNAREKVFLFEDMKKAEGKYTTDLFVNLTFNIKNVKLNGNPLTSDIPYNNIMQMVVGRPSQSEDIQVELTDSVLPTFNFI